MFEKILIANRGEIACRIMETCRRVGLRSVAVWSDADRGARHVAMADEAVHIGGAMPAQSYLRGEAIIEAALASGAEAIHPGYGFLSENPDFVEAVEAAGLIFVGPSAQAIRAMGLKDAAKALMEAAGVPVVPGYHGDDQRDEMLARQADGIGYPVLIKAVAGGGGKGMRLVQSSADFAHALQSARDEARAAFGNDVVLIEKYVAAPRHIEIQVFGDGQTALHLFERDCSLQRRHQKVIEEAPAPGMTEEMRAAMGEAAVRAAQAIGYKGAGTVEFIVDGSDGLRPDRFWFMEMNTRLQVEHPVTEAITGVDLVEWQLRVAAGEGLPLQQEALRITGHAIEARLYAEDAAKGFLPATGRLAHLRFSPLARADTGVRAGDEISPFYDPMIAKLITHGPTRAVALRRMAAALADTEVAGTVTNLAFLGALVRHQGFGAGHLDTGLIGRDLELLVRMPEPDDRALAMAALVAADVLDLRDIQTGFALWAPMRWCIRLLCGEVGHDVVLRVQGRDAHEVEIGDRNVAARRVAGCWRLDERPAPHAVRHGAQITVFGITPVTFTIEDPLERTSLPGAAAGVVEAPMPGMVKAVYAVAGQAVMQGERLAILEAMKMEHTLTAARDGVVAEVLVSVGEQIEAGAALVRLEAQEEVVS